MSAKTKLMTKSEIWYRRYQLFIFIVWFLLGVLNLAEGHWWGFLWIIGSFLWLYNWFSKGGRFRILNWFKKGQT